jgi:hypothetical protein
LVKGDAARAASQEARLISSAQSEVCPSNDRERTASLLHGIETSRLTTASIFAALFGVAGLLGCSSDGDSFYGRRPAANVNVVYDPSIDFSQYQTFAFRDDADADPDVLAALDPPSRRDLALVNRRVALELSDIGLTQVAADDADVLAFSLGRTSRATGVSWSCVGGVWGGYWYWGYYDPCAWLEPVYFPLDHTTVVVGLLDAELAEVTFTGFARGIGSLPGSRSRQIASAVNRIFDSYPARPGAAGDAGAPVLDAGAPALDAGDAGDSAAP